MPFWDKTIDLVVLTHPDADHVTGLVAVFASYEVKNVLWTEKRKDTKAFKAFEKALEKEGAQEIIAQAGQRIVFEGSKAVLEILYPEQGSLKKYGISLPHIKEGNFKRRTAGNLTP